MFSPPGLVATLVVALTLAVDSAPAQEIQPAPLSQRDVPISVDSGPVTNPGKGAAVVFSTVVKVPEAPWLRLAFDVAQLAGNPATGTGSYLQITSLLDGAVQVLDGVSVAQWRYTSAYFNGGAVRVELIAEPGVGPNRIVMSRVVAGEPGQGQRSICGSTDDRVLSSDLRVARALPIGCTAWIIDDCNRCMLTAGHCSGDLEVIEFNVPLSTGGGDLQHPPPEDQYAVDAVSLQTNGGAGIGNDWSYFGCFPNPVTGLSPGEAQGSWFTLEQPPQADGRDIRITGFGTTQSPVPEQWNQAQKTHVGPYFAFFGTTVQYQVDTTGGNSGSPVIDETTGRAIGIHTHGGCGMEAGNSGTGINHPGLTAALASPTGVCEPNGPVFVFPGGLPKIFFPDGTTVLNVLVLPNGQEIPEPGTGVFHYDAGAGEIAISMTQTSPDVYEVAVPVMPCQTRVRYYFSVRTTDGRQFTDPPSAPAATHEAVVAAALRTIADLDFESAPGWSVQDIDLDTGSWERGVPATEGLRGTPLTDQDGSGQCWLTGNEPDQDVDGGPTILISPEFDLSGTSDPTLSYARWFFNDDGDDRLVIELSDDGGATWTTAEDLSPSIGWIVASVRIADFVALTDRFRVRFSVSDNPSDSVTEAAIDRFKIEEYLCQTCLADIDRDGDVDTEDFFAFIVAFVTGDAAADVNGDGSIDTSDFFAFISAFAEGCP